MHITAVVITPLAIHHFTYYLGNTHNYPQILFSILISPQNTRATLNMLQHGKLLWKRPITASKKSQESGARAKEYYDWKLFSSVLQLNDHLLVCNLSQWGDPENYEHTRKAKYTVLSNKEALTHLYMRLNLRQALALHVYFIEIYFYHVMLLLWTLIFQSKCLFQSKSPLKGFHQGCKDSSNVSYFHV